MQYPTLNDAHLSGKCVLLRAGFDVPIEDGKVVDTTRIEAIVPTMKHVLSSGASLLIVAHQGRPKGTVVPAMSQKPLVPVLKDLLATDVQFATLDEVPETLEPGEVVLLENIRFEPNEKSKDPAERDALGQKLARLADVYVNDAFTNCHRDHASMTSVPKYMNEKYIGLNVQKEIEGLSLVIDNPKKPMTLIISGAKAETKVPVIESFLERADDIIVGGCVTNTLLASKGINIQKSRFDEDFVEKGKEILQRAESAENANIHLPTDVVCAISMEDRGEAVAVDSIPEGSAIFDIGPSSLEKYINLIENSATIVWNGPLGLFEKEQFSAASREIAKVIARATESGAVSILGGGDTLDVHERYGLSLDSYTYVSTAGGAMLDFISGKSLPALAALL